MPAAGTRRHHANTKTPRAHGQWPPPEGRGAGVAASLVRMRSAERNESHDEQKPEGRLPRRPWESGLPPVRGRVAIRVKVGPLVERAAGTSPRRVRRTRPTSWLPVSKMNRRRKGASAPAPASEDPACPYFWFAGRPQSSSIIQRQSVAFSSKVPAACSPQELDRWARCGHR